MPCASRFIKPFLILMAVAFSVGCYPALKREASTPAEALAPVRFFLPGFSDDLPLASLIEALENNLLYLNRLTPATVFQYGPDAYSRDEVLESQRALLAFLKCDPDPAALKRFVRRNFRLYRATGSAGNPKVLFTGYFEPVYPGSLRSDETHRYPLYSVPDDLLKIDLSPFGSEFTGKRIVARLDGKKVVPYYSRSQIEGEGVLAGRGLEIVWLKDPVDVAFLQIQGSGRVVLPDGRDIAVGYAAANGRPYRSIGGYMYRNGLIPKGQLSMQGIRKYLSEHPERVREVLDYNPSYVFFAVREAGPLGNIGVPVTPGRTLALDAGLFPKGALAYMCCEKPVVDNRGDIVEWHEFCRFVLNQDTGGAIKGAGRADLFWGNGSYAEMAAGNLKHEGDLYILVTKKP